MLYPDEDASLLLHSAESRGRNSTACKNLKTVQAKQYSPPKIGFSKKKSTILPTKYSAFYMELSGVKTNILASGDSPPSGGSSPVSKGISTLFWSPMQEKTSFMRLSS